MDSWTVLTPIEQGIKEKIENIGTPLKDWDINIYRGVLTGYNEAFIISGEKRQELIDQDPKSAEIIRPILRGRDIKRYSYQFADQYLIATFPSKHYNIEDYPAIKTHLLSFGIERLEQTGKEYIISGKHIKARKKTNNKWFETQDSISYWDDFSKQKIVYPDIMRLPKNGNRTEWPFLHFDTENFIPEATNFFMTGEDIQFVAAFLMSNLGIFAFIRYYTGPSFDDKGFRYKKVYLENLPIIKRCKKNEKVFNSICQEVVNIIEIRKNGLSTKELEHKINRKLYELYEFTPKEIEIIEEI